MASDSGMRKLGIAIGLFIVLILLWNPLHHLIYSVQMAMTFQKMAAGTEGQYPNVKSRKISKSFDGREYKALVYRSTKKNPTKALIIASGISPLGCYHPKLIALSSFLADQGLLVVTPDIEEFRSLKISAEPIKQYLLWHHEAETMDGAREPRKVGLAGVSYSGALALIAAANPGVRDRVAFVVSIGSYFDLKRCTQEWFSNCPDDNSTTLYARAGNYARWVMMLAALDMVPDKDRVFLKDALTDLLLEKGIRPPPQALTSDGLRYYNLAIDRKSRDEDLSLAIQKNLEIRLYRQLNPESALHEIRCPVFLIHGAYDDLIPATESEQLHQRIPNSHLLISPFLTHTQPSSAKLSWSQKAAAAFDAFCFCYRFSQAIH